MTDREKNKLLSFQSTDLDTQSTSLEKIQDCMTFKITKNLSRDVPQKESINNFVLFPYDVSGFEHVEPHSSTIDLCYESLEENSTGLVYDYAGYAWCAALCCFCPVGLIALVKSKKVESYLRKHDYKEAWLAADDARLYSACSIITGIILLAIFLFFLTTTNVFRN